jgi:hypothetical protein
MALSPKITNILQQWANNVVVIAQANLKNAGRFASGELYKSISYTITPEGDVNFSYEDYGEYVQSGRRPGARMPPIEPIKKWARIKGLPQFRDKKGKFISNEARAFIIARAIGRDGFRPVKFFDDALELALKEYPADALIDVIAEEFEKAFDEA